MAVAYIAVACRCRPPNLPPCAASCHSCLQRWADSVQCAGWTSAKGPPMCTLHAGSRSKHAILPRSNHGHSRMMRMWVKPLVQPDQRRDDVLKSGRVQPMDSSCPARSTGHPTSTAHAALHMAASSKMAAAVFVTEWPAAPCSSLRHQEAHRAHAAKIRARKAPPALRKRAWSWRTRRSMRPR